MTDTRLARFGGVKIGNDYAAMLGDDYQKMPKAVLAGIMVSLAMRLECDDPAAAVQRVHDEWATLHSAGIIPQSPR